MAKRNISLSTDDDLLFSTPRYVQSVGSEAEQKQNPSAKTARVEKKVKKARPTVRQQSIHITDDDYAILKGYVNFRRMQGDTQFSLRELMATYAAELKATYPDIKPLYGSLR